MGFYALLYHDFAFYLFGGAIDLENSPTISKLDTETTTWTKVGCSTNRFISV